MSHRWRAYQAPTKLRKESEKGHLNMPLVSNPRPEPLQKELADFTVITKTDSAVKVDTALSALFADMRGVKWLPTKFCQFCGDRLFVASWLCTKENLLTKEETP